MRLVRMAKILQEDLFPYGFEFEIEDKIQDLILDELTEMLAKHGSIDRVCEMLTSIIPEETYNRLMA